MLNRFPARPGVEIAFMGNGIDNETQVELIKDATMTGISFTECITIGFAVNSADIMLETMNNNNIPVHTRPFETPRLNFLQ